MNKNLWPVNAIEWENHEGCDHCDKPCGEKTYRNQVNIPIMERVRSIDFCIHRIVAALVAGGVVTSNSCCGHGKMHGRIDLVDGRVLIIVNQDDHLEWQSGEQCLQPSTLE